MASGSGAPALRGGAAAGLLAAGGLLLNAFAWGVSWWPFRQLQALGLHPMWATAMIYVVALVWLAVVRPQAWRAFVQHPGLWVLLVASGMTNVGFNWAVTVGDVVRAVLLFYLMPAWVVLLAWPLLGEKPTLASLTRLALALAGVVVVLKSPQSPWPWPSSLADGLALVGGFSFALTNVMLRRLRDTPTDASMLAMFGGGGLLAVLAAGLGLQQGLGQAGPTPAWPWLLGVGAMSLLILLGNLGLQYGAARLSASATSVIMLSEVVIASASAVWLGAGSLEARTVVGGALILLASLLAAVGGSGDAPPEPA